MKKTLKIFGIISAVLGFVFTALTVVSLILTIVNFKNTSDTLAVFTLLIPEIIALPFAILEFKDGIELINVSKKNRVDKLIRPIAQLSVSVLGSITAAALSAFALLIVDAISSSGSFNFKDNILTIIGVLIILVGFMLTNVFKTNAPLPLSIVSIIYGVVGFVYAIMNNYVVGSSIINTIGNVVNLVILLVVFIFAILFIIYYAKHKTEIDIEYDKELDYDIIKKYKNDIAKVKVYQVRYGEGGKTTKALLLIGCILYALFVVVASIQDIIKIYGTSFDFSSFSPTSIGSLGDSLGLLLIVPTIPYVIIVIYSVIRNNSTLYSYLIAFLSRFIYFAFITISPFVALITGNISKMIFLSVIAGVLYIGALVLAMIAKNHFQKMHDGLKKGDSFLSVGENASKSAIYFCIISGIFTLPYILSNILNGKAPSISVFIFLISCVLITIAIARNPKHNMEESFVTFHSLKATMASEEIKANTTVTEAATLSSGTEEVKPAIETSSNDPNEDKAEEEKKKKIAQIIKIIILVVGIIILAVIFLPRFLKKWK